ncbi:hypothetical protein AB6A40_001829 [Gnathostoma spinigerum]|uniref:RNA 3'-terminal phosphate cyclase domain-containing protein n=1 Tax=Gnathostoma spinigerum TaxID=75299 RepID=A0ABD6EFN6_9BILA
MEVSEELVFTGCNFFRQRLTYSLLSGKPIIIREIRSMDDNPGIRDFEATLLSLLEKITNGTRIEIGPTGTDVSFTPGVLDGSKIELDCGNKRCLSYFLEPLILLAPFCKHPLDVRLCGITNAPGELSVDAIKSTWLPVFRRFILNDENLDLQASFSFFSIPLVSYVNLERIKCKFHSN